MGAIFETPTHYPVMLTKWIKVIVTCWTYNFEALLGSVFILAILLDES
jgi:pterin-4a-carbinolamine dehydratase